MDEVQRSVFMVKPTEEVQGILVSAQAWVRRALDVRGLDEFVYDLLDNHLMWGDSANHAYKWFCDRSDEETIKSVSFDLFEVAWRNGVDRILKEGWVPYGYVK